MVVFLIWGWEIIRPCYDGSSTLSRGAHGARWLHEPPPYSSQPIRVGFPHRARRYRTEDSLFSSPVVVYVWKYFPSGDETIFSQVAAGSMSSG